MKYFDELGNSNWCSRVKQLLQSTGFNYVWEMQDIQIEYSFISAFVQRLKDQYIQNWFSAININRKLILYKDFKLNFTHEYYLDIISVRKFRHVLTQIRTGHHPLEIERGRYMNIPREQRLCKMCTSDIEDEYHFVLRCNAYNDLRNLYIPKKFYMNPNLHKFNMLFCSRSADILHTLAKFLYYAFKRRSDLLK